jgi:hypothetical protein
MKNGWMAVLLFSTYLSAQISPLHLHFAAGPISFYAAGRWVPSNPKEKSFAPSETEIDCNRKSASCVEATAEYYSGHPHVSLAYFDVVKWDENGIIATSSSSICMTETVLIAFADKTISAKHSMKILNSEKKQACTTVGAGEPYIESFVIKNSLRWNADPYGESMSNKP